MPWFDSVPEEIKLTPAAAPACARPIYIYEYNPTRSGKVADDPIIGIYPSAFSEDEE